MKKIILLVTLLAILLIAAAPLKYTFFEPGLTVEATDKPAYTQCVYWEPGEYTAYENYLGWYGANVKVAGSEVVRQFCLDNFENRLP